MEFILFLLFLILHLVFFAIVSYLSRLLFFEKKEEYYREEIVSLGRAIPIELLRIFESGGNAVLGLAFFTVSALVVFLWAMLGGAIGSPHYTHSLGNYFFHFPLFFFAFIFSYSFIKSSAEPNNPQDPLNILTKYGQAIAIGLGTGSLAKILTSYGMHHEMYFLFFFFHLILISLVSAYLWNGLSFLGLAMPSSTESNWEENNWQDDSEDFAYKKEENSLDSSDFDLEWDDFAEKPD